MRTRGKVRLTKKRMSILKKNKRGIQAARFRSSVHFGLAHAVRGCSSGDLRLGSGVGCDPGNV